MAGGVLAAVAGYMFTYYNSKLQKEREARIERVNEQLKEFYGPLLACITATKSAFDAIEWIQCVLQPLNEKAASIIIDHADLLESPRIVPELLQLVAHVSTYRVIVNKWNSGEHTFHSVITYPDNILIYIQEEYAKLKARQAKLLGMSNDIRSKL